MARDESSVRRDKAHRAWVRARGDELAAIGLPLRVYQTPDRWADFLANGHLHWHDDGSRFSFESLPPDARAALHRFLEREEREGGGVPALLGFLRVRAAPELDESVLASAMAPEWAIAWLASRGAHPWLVRHHELVLEAAEEIVDRVPVELGVSLDRAHVLVGVALHDAGKIAHPSEMSVPGAAHEAAGETLLLRAGLPPRIARACVTHAAWTDPRATIEDRLIALADKLWKGKRDAELEHALVEEIAARTQRATWDVFGILDAICEDVAARGPARLARSQV